MADLRLLPLAGSYRGVFVGREVYIKGTDITNESDLWKTQLYKGFEKHGTDDQLAHPANANLATGGGGGSAQRRCNGSQRVGQRS